MSSPRQTYVAWVQDCRILFAYLGKYVALVAQQPVHIPDEPQVVLVSRCLAYRLPPFFDQLEDLVLDARRMHGRALWESADELIEKLLCADLQVEGVSAVLDANVEKLYLSKPVDV
jgi:hypothetical protein